MLEYVNACLFSMFQFLDVEFISVSETWKHFPCFIIELEWHIAYLVQECYEVLYSHSVFLFFWLLCSECNHFRKIEFMFAECFFHLVARGISQVFWLSSQKSFHFKDDHKKLAQTVFLMLQPSHHHSSLGNYQNSTKHSWNSQIMEKKHVYHDK